MNLRTKSKAQQWAMWFCAALVGLAVYVVLSRLLNGSMNWNIVLPLNQRIVLPILAFSWLFAWETRWDGVRREAGGEEGVEKRCRCRAEGGSGSAGQPSDDGRARTPAAPQSQNNVDSLSNDCGGPGVSALPQRDESDARLQVHSTPNTYTSASSPSDDASGEELYARARGCEHRMIPDFRHDAEYLGLLGASAAKGHSPALAKLGEYAMRRAAWVEAYYWMKQAQRNGMHGLSPMLREIRNRWARDGFPRQSSNVNKIFTEEAGRLGRALLSLDSGREAAKAREFLKAHHPEFGRISQLDEPK